LDNAVIANFATTASDGKTYNVDHCSLDIGDVNIMNKILCSSGAIIGKANNNDYTLQLMKYVYIDESGDLGSKKSSSKYFVLAGIMVQQT
jgi:hypothetical protein